MYRLYAKLLLVLPYRISLFICTILKNIQWVIMFYKWNTFKPSNLDKDWNIKNVFLYSCHPYTSKITKNGLESWLSGIKSILYWTITKYYTDLSMDFTMKFLIEPGLPMWYYVLWGRFLRWRYKSFFDKIDIYSSDLFVLLPFFDMNKKCVIYLNHRFCY